VTPKFFQNLRQSWHLMDFWLNMEYFAEWSNALVAVVRGNWKNI
jgi:hypothetical protein